MTAHRKKITMKMITRLALSSLALTCLNSVAAPVEYDTPDAHIVVIRPMDQWNPDESVAQKLDKNYLRGEYAGQYSITPKEYFSLWSDEPFANLFRAKYPNKEKGGSVYIMIGYPAAINPLDTLKFTGGQNAYYVASVLAQGNPITLSNRINTSQIWRNVLTVATIGAAGALGGGNLAGGVAGSSLASQVGDLALDAKQALINVKPLKIDYTKYKQIDVRKTSANGNMGPKGQIIIAYKTEKTQAAEDEALAIGLASTLGFDTTKEATMASRAADLADRQAIWDKCVADGKCKNEE